MELLSEVDWGCGLGVEVLRNGEISMAARAKPEPPRQLRV